MPLNRTLTALALLLPAGSTVAGGQDAPAGRNEAAAEIGARRRAFYFNLAHNG
jgi:hypothetical protein